MGNSVRRRFPLECDFFSSRLFQSLFGLRVVRCARQLRGSLAGARFMKLHGHHSTASHLQLSRDQDIFGV